MKEDRLPGKRLTATFRPQAWVNDYAIDTGENVEFDATAAFLENDVEDIRSYRENDYPSDHLSIGLPAREAHGGPFEVDCDVNSWLEENGIEDRTKITQKELTNLRRRYGIRIRRCR